VLTTDAGIGKTANLEWLHWKINTAGDGRLALLVPINELAGSYDQFLPETLVKCFRRYGVAAIRGAPEQDEAELILRRLRDSGQIVLLFDALDQTGAASPQIKTLCEIVAHPDWQHCRIVISGRPHALVLHWDAAGSPQHRLAISASWRNSTGAAGAYLGQTASGESRYEEDPPRGARDPGHAAGAAISAEVDRRRIGPDPHAQRRVLQIVAALDHRGDAEGSEGADDRTGQPTPPKRRQPSRRIRWTGR
jgi:hypothetical protein